MILLPPSPFSPTNLITCQEFEIQPQKRSQSKRCPPPTLPKPARPDLHPKYSLTEKPNTVNDCMQIYS